MKKEDFSIQIPDMNAEFIDVTPTEFSLFSTHHMEEPLWVCDSIGVVHRIYAINTYHASASLEGLDTHVEIITASVFESKITNAVAREFIIGGDIDKITCYEYTGIEIGTILKKEHRIDAYYEWKKIEDTNPD